MITVQQCKACRSSWLFTIKKYTASSRLNDAWRRVFETILNRSDTQEIRLVICGRCGCIFYRDIFDLDELTKLYANEHRFQSSRKKNIERGGNEEVRRILAFFKQYIDFSKFDSIIDIGAGDFTLMDHVMELAPQAKLAAIDPCFESEMYRGRVRVLQTMIEKLNVDKQYDCALAIHILEHVADTDVFMEKLSLLTREYVYVEVPFQVGPGLLLNRAVNTQHINYFSPATLSTLLGRHGFSIEQLEFDTDGYSYNGMPGMIRVLAKKTGRCKPASRFGLMENLYYLFSPLILFRFVWRKMIS